MSTNIIQCISLQEILW